MCMSRHHMVEHDEKECAVVGPDRWESGHQSQNTHEGLHRRRPVRRCGEKEHDKLVGKRGTLKAVDRGAGKD